LRAKMGAAGQNGIAKVPIPATSHKFGKKDDHISASNPFGYSQDDQDHYWYVNTKLSQ